MGVRGACVGRARCVVKDRQGRSSAAVM
jgi:hypothetical protein